MNQGGKRDLTLNHEVLAFGTAEILFTRRLKYSSHSLFAFSKSLPLYLVSPYLISLRNFIAF